MCFSFPVLDEPLAAAECSVGAAGFVAAADAVGDSHPRCYHCHHRGLHLQSRPDRSHQPITIRKLLPTLPILLPINYQTNLTKITADSLNVSGKFKEMCNIIFCAFEHLYMETTWYQITILLLFSTDIWVSLYRHAFRTTLVMNVW